MAAVSVGSVGIVDTNNGGPYAMAVGTTKRVGEPDFPTRVRVVLFDQTRGLLIRELWSNAETGEYQFRRIRAGKFFVVAFDHTGAYNGEVVTDIVVPAP